MGLNCACPPAASLTGFAIPECLEGFGQVNKVIFQRIFSAAGTKNKLIGDPAALASWTPAFLADDGTKMVITPYVSNPTVTAGAKKTYGGGNATPGGLIKIIGAEPTAFTAQFDDMPQSVIKAMKALMCENVGVYLVNERGQIGLKKVTIDGTPVTYEYMPIPIASLFIGDKVLGGLDNPDTNAIEWNWPANWSDDFAVITPNFDALGALVNSI
jgi:hypothetical protein